jgi:membrane protease YdiL (CAAX protease family)
MRRPVPILAAAVPYAAVAIGLYAARSAWATILLYHVGIVLVLAATDWRRRLGLARSGWRGGVAALTAAGAVGGGVALYVLWPYIDATPQGLGRALSDFGLTGAGWLTFAIYYSTVHPFLEELFWRGDRAEGSGAPNWRDAAFAGYHVPVLRFFIGPAWIVISFVVLLLAAWLWRLAARRFGGLGVPLLSHAIADVSIITAATLLIFK